MTHTSYYSDAELSALGFAHVGRNVRISRHTSLYGTGGMSIGDNVRIDDFCVLSGRIALGSHIHIAAYCGLFGGGGITLGDFAGLSSRVSIYSESEDYSGTCLTNPTIPDAYRRIDSAPVTLGRHTIVGAGAVILPGADIGDGSSVGALSLVTRPLDPWGVYAGVPARRLKARKKDLLEKERDFLGGSHG